MRFQLLIAFAVALILAPVVEAGCKFCTREKTVTKTVVETVVPVVTESTGSCSASAELSACSGKVKKHRPGLFHKLFKKGCGSSASSCGEAVEASCSSPVEATCGG